MNGLKVYVHTFYFTVYILIIQCQRAYTIEAKILPFLLYNALDVI